MKIAVITFHNTMNYGASLQCAALSRRLTSLGNQVEVVNYLPYYVQDKRSPLKELKKARNLRGFVKGTAYLAHTRVMQGRNRKIGGFLGENVTLTREYHSIAELRANPPKAELYLCGSDQIWNPTLTGDSLDEAFFLRFGNRDVSRAAYGVSVGELDAERFSDELREFTKGFDCVSVREKSIAERLSKVLGREVSAVLDPTLLLEKEDCRTMERPCKPCPGKYLLLYTVRNSDAAVKAAKRIAAERGLSLVDISLNPFHRVRHSIKMLNIGPGEFLTLFRNAEYVIANSFHGTAFSVLYEKDFNSALHPVRGARERDLLSALGLTDRILTDADKLNMNAIDYQSVRDKLSALRYGSNAFIQRMLDRGGQLT